MSRELKTTVSLSLPTYLVKRLDAEAEESDRSRSKQAEIVLRQGFDNDLEGGEA